MGCCQSSTASAVDQVCLYANNDLHRNQESVIEECFTYQVPDNNCIKNTSASRADNSETQQAVYCIGEKISSCGFGSRFLCLIQPNESRKEIIQIDKSKLLQSQLEVFIENANLLVKVFHENLSQVYHVGLEEKFVNIVTDLAIESLELTMKEKKIDVGAYFQQILKGVECWHKAGVALCRLTLAEIFLVDGVLKISPVAIVPERGNSSDCKGVDEGSDVKRLGILLVCMISSMVGLSDMSQVLNGLENSSLDVKDLQMIKKMIGDDEERPSLNNLLEYQWNLGEPIVYHSKKPSENPINLEVPEKLVSYISSSLSIAEEENSERLEMISKSSSLESSSFEIVLKSHPDLSLKSSEIEENPDKVHVKISTGYLQFSFSLDLPLNPSESIDLIDLFEVSKSPQNPISYQENPQESENIMDWFQEELKEVFELPAKVEIEESKNIEIKIEEPKNIKSEIEESKKAEFLEHISEESIEIEIEESKKAEFLEHISEESIETPIRVNDDKSSEEFFEKSPRISEENPLDRPTIEPVLTSEKSPVQFSLTESPVFDNFLPQIEEFDSKDEKTELFCENPSEVMDSPFELAEDAVVITGSSINDLQSLESCENFTNDPDNDSISNIRLYRSGSVTCPKLISRLSRVSLTFDKVIAEEATGKLKFYSFKQRYGFIIWDKNGSDVFLCEDDVILSGIRLKTIKAAVTKKKELLFSFAVMRYQKDGKDSQKAVNLKILNA